MSSEALPSAVADTLAAITPWKEGRWLTGLEPGVDGIAALLDLAGAIRTHENELARLRPLAGKVFAGMFFDPSLRTRTSMDVACAKLGDRLRREPQQRRRQVATRVQPDQDESAVRAAFTASMRADLGNRRAQRVLKPLDARLGVQPHEHVRERAAVVRNQR